MDIRQHTAALAIPVLPPDVRLRTETRPYEHARDDCLLSGLLVRSPNRVDPDQYGHRRMGPIYHNSHHDASHHLRPRTIHQRQRHHQPKLPRQQGDDGVRDLLGHPDDSHLDVCLAAVLQGLDDLH